MCSARTIRMSNPSDDDAIWRVIEPVFCAGETYPLPRDISRADAFAYWRAPGQEVFVAEEQGKIVGSYYLRANNRGGGSHVANCGYIVAADASGRGVARAMCEHSLERARERGFTAMQFNFVISSNKSRKVVAELRVRDRRHFASSIHASDLRVGRRLRDV